MTTTPTTRAGVATLAALVGLTACSSPTDAPVPAEVQVAPEALTFVSLGDTQELSATVLDDQGDPISGLAVTWESSDEEVATVSTQGVVTAVGEGTATVTARAGDASASVDVTVQIAAQIELDPAGGTLSAIGETLQLTATVLDGSGNAIPDAEVTWSSSGLTIVSVDDEGVVTAVGAGTATITAESGDASAEVTITVELGS